MPGKSKHGRGKHPQHSKRSKIRQRQAVGTGIQQAAATDAQPQAVQSVAQPAAPARPVMATKPKTGPASVAATFDPTYIVSELKRIGILTGIAVVIIIILALVLR